MMKIEDMLRLFVRLGGVAWIRRWLARSAGSGPAGRQAGEATRRMEQIQRITRRLWR
jgi:hypothetical protein